MVTIADATEGMVVLVVGSVERVTSESAVVTEVLGTDIGDRSTISGFVSVVIDGQLPTYPKKHTW